MPYYADAAHFYANLRALFQCVQANHPHATDDIAASRMLIHMRITGPEAEVSLNGRQEPVEVSYGGSGLRPDLDITLAADTLHRILLGEQSLTRALGSGLMQVKGPIWKAMALAEVFRVGQACYPGILREESQQRDG